MQRAALRQLAIGLFAGWRKYAHVVVVALARWAGAELVFAARPRVEHHEIYIGMERAGWHDALRVRPRQITHPGASIVAVCTCSVEQHGWVTPVWETHAHGIRVVPSPSEPVTDALMTDIITAAVERATNDSDFGIPPDALIWQCPDAQRGLSGCLARGDHTRVLWRGVFLTAGMAAAAIVVLGEVTWVAVALVTTLRAVRRSARGQCTSCGYPLASNAANQLARCPECGESGGLPLARETR